MSTTTEPRTMTIDEFLALPDDPSVRRELIRGTLVEGESMVTNDEHATIVTRIAGLLFEWAKAYDARWIDRIKTGDAGFRLASSTSLVGIDVAIAASGEITGKISHETPLVAIEVVSPNDGARYLAKRVELFLDSDIRVVWLIYPEKRVVEVYRPGCEMLAFTYSQSFHADPELPGLNVRVADLFPATQAEVQQ